jgi:hypothetical protein
MRTPSILADSHSRQNPTEVFILKAVIAVNTPRTSNLERRKHGYRAGGESNKQITIASDRKACSRL